LVIVRRRGRVRSPHPLDDRTIATLASEFVPKYPKDDVYFSADASRFTLTRYSLDGTLERYVGTTADAEVLPLDLGVPGQPRVIDLALPARLGRFDLRPANSLTQLELQVPRLERLVGPPRAFLANKGRKFTPVGTIETLQNKLAQAGSRGGHGFETAITVNNPGPYFAVTANDASGQTLGQSPTILVQK